MRKLVSLIITGIYVIILGLVSITFLSLLDYLDILMRDAVGIVYSNFLNVLYVVCTLGILGVVGGVCCTVFVYKFIYNKLGI